MTQKSMEDIIEELILNEEGGWQLTNHPLDVDKGTYGGMRMRNINRALTQADLPALTYDELNEVISIASDSITIRGCEFSNELIKETVRHLYVTEYASPLQLIKVAGIIDQNFASALFSAGVNMGTTRAIRMLQESINIAGTEYASAFKPLALDGVIGPVSLTRLRALSLIYVNSWAPICVMQLTFYKLWRNRYIDIVKSRPSQIVFLKGWMNRVDGYSTGFTQTLVSEAVYALARVAELD